MPTPTTTHTYLELHVPDFAQAKDFYSQLGFQVVWDTPPGPDGYLVMQLGQNILGFYGGTEDIYHHPFFSSPNFRRTLPAATGSRSPSRSRTISADITKRLRIG